MYMTFDEITKIIEMGFTFIGLIFVVFGWIIPYKQRIKEEKRRKKEESEFKKRQWEKELIDRQISCLYGPLSELLREQEILWELILYQLGRRNIFSDENYRLSDLPENEQKIWVHYVDTYKIPLQNRMLEIIQNNQHLLYKSEVPESYKVFLEYVLGWELLDNQKKNGVPNYYEYYYRYNYPVAFNNYVFSMLSVLQKRQEELVKAL